MKNLLLSILMFLVVITVGIFMIQKSFMPDPLILITKIELLSVGSFMIGISLLFLYAGIREFIIKRKIRKE